MKTVTGDLIGLALDGQYDVIIQGCNCLCQMGKGIALTIKTIFPEAYAADLETPKGDPTKLGTYSSATILVGGKPLTIVNAYTQYTWKGDGVLADYPAIAAVMQKIKQDFSGKKIGIPLIGAGLAKGDWNVISSIIDQELYGEDLTLVTLPS